ncbi:MAG: metallophosphoesterase [Elusimicrobia bacterium]|nr:metallophosphoesterase [Elusimicrobiota bacterium]
MILPAALALAVWAAEPAAWPPVPPGFSRPDSPLFSTLAKPEPPTEDLLAAGARWSNAAQAGRILPVARDSTFKIAVIGDAEPGRFSWERIFSPGKDAFARQLASIQSGAAKVVVQLGDFVSRGTVDNYRAHVRFLDERVRVPLLTVQGNHDRSRPNGSGDKSLYRAVFGPGDSYADVGGWRLVLVDTADRRLRPEQLAWLETALSGAERSLIFMHVPPAFLKGRIVAEEFQDMGADPEGYHPFEAFFEEGSREFGELASRHRVARVYVAHIHAFGHARHLGVPYVLSGGGGSPLYPLPPGWPARFAHYIDAELSPSGVRETVRKLDGSSFELNP